MSLQHSEHVERTVAKAAVRSVRALVDALYVLPVVLAVGIVLLLPLVSVATHSFTDWQPGYSNAWVGLANYSELLGSETFHQILVNQAFLLIGIPLWTILPLVIASLLYERVPAPGVFRTVFFFPATISPVVIGILFSFILAPGGPVNAGLRAVGLDGLTHNWLVEESLVKPVIIAVLAWATLGTGVVIFAAALSGIAPELFEAAELEGANWWQRLRYITVPSIRRVIELWVVILVVTLFVGVFPWIYTLTRGGPGYSSTTIDFDIYQNALTFGYFGLAAAEAVILLVIVAAVVSVGALVARGRRSTA